MRLRFGFPAPIAQVGTMYHFVEHARENVANGDAFGRKTVQLA